MKDPELDRPLPKVSRPAVIPAKFKKMQHFRVTIRLRNEIVFEEVVESKRLSKVEKLYPKNGYSWELKQLAY